MCCGRSAVPAVLHPSRGQPPSAVRSHWRAQTFPWPAAGGGLRFGRPRTLARPRTPVPPCGMPVTDMFRGALYGGLEDPFGHSGSVAAQIRDLTAQEIEAA